MSATDALTDMAMAHKRLTEAIDTAEARGLDLRQVNLLNEARQFLVEAQDFTTWALEPDP